VRREATITAVSDAHGRLSHWVVRFENQGEAAWIGTVVFDGAAKNDGMGARVDGSTGEEHRRRAAH